MKNNTTAEILVNKADESGEKTKREYTLNGVEDKELSLDFLKNAENGDYVLTENKITFGKKGSTVEKEVWLISEELERKKTILYVDDQNDEVIGKSRVTGKYGEKNKEVNLRSIDGYTYNGDQVTVSFNALPNKKEKPVKVYYTKDDKESSSSSEDTDNSSSSDGNSSVPGDNSSGDTDVDTDGNSDTDGNGNNAGNNTGNSNANNTTTSVSPFKVYGKKKLYRYSHATFTNNRRVQTHAKKVKAHALVFTVVGKTTSKTGAARYVLNDGTHITAKADYVGKLYWASDYRKLYVTHPKGINTYKSTTLNQKVKSLKQGTTVTVKAVAKKGQMTRYRLADGTYITGNKQYVSPTKPKTVKQVKAKTRVRVYQDVNLNKVVKTYQPGKVIKVNGWNHSRGDVHHVSGVKRYKVAGGYITANSKYVKVVK